MSFNSLMVRLKDPVSRSEPCKGSRFQFPNGSIKSIDYIKKSLSSFIVSIP